MSLAVETSFSLGFMKPFDGLPLGSPSAFGTPSAGGSMAFADPEIECHVAPKYEIENPIDSTAALCP